VLSVQQAAMKQRKASYRVTASDENGAQEAYRTHEVLTHSLKRGDQDGDDKGVPLFEKLNVHACNGWDWQERLRDLASGQGIPKIWMSEVTYREQENAGSVPDDMRCALPITRSVVSDIKRLHCSAWVYWQPVEPMEYCQKYRYTYGLLPVCVDSNQDWNGKIYHPGEFVIAKSFDAIRQFTAFIRPRFKLVASGDFWTLAAVSADSMRVVLVVHNDSAQDKPYTFDLTQFAQVGGKAQLWRTRDNVNGETYNCRPLPPLPVRDRRFGDLVPAQSVTTYVVDLAGSILGSGRLSLMLRRGRHRKAAPWRHRSRFRTLPRSQHPGCVRHLCGLAGVPERVIQKHTGHKGVTMLRKYIREGDLWRENAEAEVGLLLLLHKTNPHYLG
jgi:hypothetical protein